MCVCACMPACVRAWRVGRQEEKGGKTGVRARVCPCVCIYIRGCNPMAAFQLLHTVCVCVCLTYIAALLFWGCFNPKALAVWLHMACGLWPVAFAHQEYGFSFP